MVAIAGSLLGSGVPAVGSAAQGPSSRAVTAPTDDIALLELEVPTVLGITRTEQKLEAVPAAVSVVTADDIRWAGARSIGDALRLVPGMDVTELSYANFGASPRGFQGLFSDQVLVLVDGRQIFDAMFNGTFWGQWPFQLEDIERIEVIRGPGGVSWGPNTLNGVINIVTKDPRDQRGLTVTGGGGSRGTNKEHLGYGFSDGKLRLRVSGEYEGSDGFREGGFWLRKLDDDYKAGRMGIHAIYEASPEDTLLLSAGSGITDGGIPPSPMCIFDKAKNPGSQAEFVLGKWTHRTDSVTRHEITGYVNDFWLCAGAAAIEYRYQQFALQYSAVLERGNGHTISWGLDSRADRTDGRLADPFVLDKNVVGSGLLGLYLQDEWRFAPQWSLHVGGRMDYEFYGGFQPSGRVALSREILENHFVYAAAARAYQMLPAGLRFVDLPVVGGLVRTTCDRDVGAQTLVAYEAGYRGRFLHGLQTDANVFWHEYADQVTVSPEPGPPGVLQKRLARHGDGSLYGFELEARYPVTPRLVLVGNYTFQYLDWRGDVPFTDQELLTPPRHKFMLGARYSVTDDLRLSAHAYYVDAVRAPNPMNPFGSLGIDPYIRLDLRAEYEFWKKQASVAVGVRNLLDPDHYEGACSFLNTAAVPRMVYAEMRVTIK